MLVNECQGNSGELFIVNIMSGVTLVFVSIILA